MAKNWQRNGRSRGNHAQSSRQQTEERVPPVFSVRSGGLEVSVWEHDNGEGTVLSATVKKTYYDEDKEEWVESRTFFPNELAVLSALLSQAFQFCANVQSKQ